MGRVWGTRLEQEPQDSASIRITKSRLMLTSLWNTCVGEQRYAWWEGGKDGTHAWGHVWSKKHDFGASITTTKLRLMLTSL